MKFINYYFPLKQFIYINFLLTFQNDDEKEPQM